MNLGVVGSRLFKNYEYVKEVLNLRIRIVYKVNRIISGGAIGADSLARQYSEEHKIPITEFLPDWDKYGRSAGFKRNQIIVDHSDALIAFWDEMSKGTANTVRLAKKKGIPVHIYWKEV